MNYVKLNSGNMRLNLNLGNAAVGPGVVSLFGQFNLGAPTTHLSYGGINAGLMGWNIGDEIFTSGGPPTFATTFISGNANLDSISVLDRDNLSAHAVVSVPEPSNWALIAVGAFALLIVRKRWQRA